MVEFGSIEDVIIGYQVLNSLRIRGEFLKVKIGKKAIELIVLFLIEKIKEYENLEI